MDIDLIAQIRTKTGKGAARSLRRHDRVPAAIYGPKTMPLALSVEANQLKKLLRKMGEEASQLIRLVIEGEEHQTKQVMIREVQTHPARRRFLHVDFYEVAMDQPIEVDIHVELTGESVGEEKGGIVNLVRRTLSVRCLPADIPEKITVDISSLDIGDAIHVEDLIPKVSFELTGEEHFTVVTINAPEGAEEAESVESEEEEGEGEEVEG
jgi:large subunit ribosomal protein L25